ncbi:unnamed protein product [Notodromas monacha]|uniref:Uncharacterized protein n=1 Tax=Notodromas monacha TaxID=399045 RepID=A0A7R9GE43_9CRUS|nr:unnamed protein product [Notodromas monacha]CAG0919373.1 unnamed protein product [Notodromas monacha]
MPEEETDLDALLDPQCLRDESAIFEDVIKRLEESGCPSPLPGCASMHPGRGPLLEAEGLAKPSGLDPSLGPAFPDSVEEPMLHLDLDSSLYSPSPEHSVDTFSPSDVPSDAASLTSSSLCVKKDTTWSDSLSSNGSPMETDSLDLHLSGEDCSQLICEDLPLIGSREALWFTTVAENVSCEP